MAATTSTPVETPATGSSAPATGVRRRAAAAAIAVGSAVLVWIVASALLDIELVVAPPGQPQAAVGIAATIIVSLGAAVLGWAALALLERLSPGHATAIWTVLAVLVLLGSFGGVAAASTTATAVTLGLLHLLVGGVLIAGLPAWRRR